LRGQPFTASRRHLFDAILPGVLDQVDITFDDPRAVAHAGLLLPATLAERLGIEQTTDQLVDLGDRIGAAPPGRKLLCRATCGPESGRRSSTLTDDNLLTLGPMIKLGQRTSGCPWSANCGCGERGRRLDRRRG
jgi:hypothetical protein